MCAVVAARVHLAGDLRRVRGAGFFDDMQGVEIGAQADRAVALAAAEHADDAGVREPRVHFEPERPELVSDEGARRRFLERRLRVRMDMVTPRLHLGNKRGDFGGDLTGISPKSSDAHGRYALAAGRRRLGFGGPLIQA